MHKSSPYKFKDENYTDFIDPKLWLGEGFCNLCNEYHGTLSQQCYAWCTGIEKLKYHVKREEALFHFKTCTKNNHINCGIYTIFS